MLSTGSNDNEGNNTTNKSEEVSASVLRRRQKKLLRAKQKSRRVDWKKQKWVSRKPQALTPSHETCFVELQLRKLQRKMEGRKTQKQSRVCENVLVLVACMLILWGGFYYEYDPEDPNAPAPPQTPLEEWYGTIVILWVFVTWLLISMFAETAFTRPLYWMLIYLPVLTFTAYISFYEDGTHYVQDSNTGEKSPTSDWQFGHYLAILLLAAEALTVASFVLYYYAYPKFIRSQWFQGQPGRPAWYWSVQVIADWTFTYKEMDRKLRKRYTCKYVGDRSPQTGLPHGWGRWYDDAYEGEILTGYWKDGVPVAPFVSHHYGSGNALRAVRIAYFKANDDEWDRNAFLARNTHPPQAGVASVECSVSGSFYNHLPCSTLLEGPYPVVGQPKFMERVIEELIHVDGLQDRHSKMIQIKANDPRGIQVIGHYYQPTGEYSAKEPESVTVVVKRTRKDPHGWIHQSNNNFMPRPTLTTRKENVIVCDDPLEEDFSSDEDSEDLEEQLPVEPPVNGTDHNHVNRDRRHHGYTANLRVVGWTPATHKDALVFMPGYSSCMKNTLESFGQFIAMSSLDDQVYPILYQWPNATQLSYPSASHAAASSQNDVNFLQLIQGLAAAGVRNVHLMSHSMGAQTLVGVFRDKIDDNKSSRSEVSKCFRLMPEFATDDEESPGDDGDDSNLLICKTITMLNPDFPVGAFVDRGFRSLRQICNTITVVADRNDAALFGSSICNGVGTYLGYKQPEALRPVVGPYEAKLGLQHVVGRSIDLLHFPDELLEGDDNNPQHDERLVFQERAPLTLSADDEANDHLWLDMDVIDTTGLDTNIEGVRHGGYNLNSILLKDIKEVIATGNRAMRRSTLLYRDGNDFTYAHAPSFVAA